MDSVFDNLETAQAGEDQTDSWWKKAAQVAMRSSFSETTKDQIIAREQSNTDDANGVRYTPRVGTMVLFEYDAKATKQRLPYLSLIHI